MPVFYNCSVCRKRLSVSRRKIGEKLECPFCSSYTEVPGEDQPSLPKVEFLEAQERDEPPAWSGSEVEELSHQPSPQRADPPVETHFRQESGTPTEGRGTAGDFNSASLPERGESSVEEAMWNRPAEHPEAETPIRFRRAANEFEEMDLTPMVDVTFLLLIFFMITASFTLEKTIPTPVPDPNEQSAAQPIQQQDELLEKSIRIGIESDNTITIDDEPLPDSELLRDRLTDLMIREQKAEALVAVADLAMQETVVYVLDTANDVGMQKIRLAATPSEAD